VKQAHAWYHARDRGCGVSWTAEQPIDTPAVPIEPPLPLEIRANRVRIEGCTLKTLLSTVEVALRTRSIVGGSTLLGASCKGVGANE
jgi:hypothetical protein